MHRVLFLQKDDHRGRSGQVSICVLNRYRIFRADSRLETHPEACKQATSRMVGYSLSTVLKAVIRVFPFWMSS